MTTYQAIYNNLRETVADYYGESEADEPSYDLDLLTWSAVLAVPQAVQSAEEARELAIDWQTWTSGGIDLSYGDLAEWSSYFEQLARTFPALADEFAENGIIGRDCPHEHTDTNPLGETNCLDCGELNINK